MKKALLPLLCVLALAGHTVLGQTTPPAPPATPAAPAPATPPAPATAAPARAADQYLLGRSYRVETMQGTTFTGTLVSMSLTGLEFEGTEMGHITLERAQVRRADLQGPLRATAKAGYYDIGSGSRYFFGPSGRNLRMGEGVVQDVWLFLGGVNYGITDNFSVGGYLSLLPGVGLQNQFLMLTPKVSVQAGDNWHLGAGTLFVRVPNGDNGVGAGLLYGVATRGSADNNFSLGVGYGYASGGIGGTPTVYLAGQTRVSRRISLVSENYAVAAHSPFFFGLYGLKINWPRTSLGIASGYVGYVDNTPLNYGYSGRSDDSFFFFGYVCPIYLDFTFRFGKVQ